MLFGCVRISKPGIIVSVANALSDMATGLAFVKVISELHGNEIPEVVPFGLFRISESANAGIGLCGVGIVDIFQSHGH